MIKLIVGNKGSGKTKTLIKMVNNASQTSKGNIICVEKGAKLTYDIKHTVRLVDIDNYGIANYEAFTGFIAGLYAGNYDLTEVFVDGILKICGRDFDALGKMLENIDPIIKTADSEIVFTISADASELPDSVKKFL